MNNSLRYLFKIRISGKEQVLIEKLLIPMERKDFLSLERLSYLVTWPEKIRTL